MRNKLDPSEYVELNFDKSMTLDSTVGLTPSQAIISIYHSSEHMPTISKRLYDYFDNDKSLKEDSVFELILEIDNFINGLLFNQYTGKDSTHLIQPFNDTMKAFIGDVTINRLSESDVIRLTSTKHMFLDLLWHRY